MAFFIAIREPDVGDGFRWPAMVCPCFLPGFFKLLLKTRLCFIGTFWTSAPASSVDSVCSSVSVFYFHLSTAQVSVKVLLAPLSLAGPRENTSIPLSMLLVWTTPLETNRDNRTSRNHSHMSHLSREIAAGRGGGHIVRTSRTLPVCLVSSSAYYLQVHQFPSILSLLPHPTFCLFSIVSWFSGSQTQIPDLDLSYVMLALELCTRP